jgi:hypothetical protein
VAKHSRNKAPRHVMIFHHLMDSQAWKSLGAVPRAVYLDMAKRYHGSNNGRIGYSIRCAVQELQIGNATAKRALDDLQDRGFIVATKKGAFSLKVRHASEWRLTCFKNDVGNELATNDYKNWVPGKNKTRMLQRKRTDAVAEAIGCCSGTSLQPDTADGCCSGSVEASSDTASDAVAEHIYLPGTGAEKAVSEARPSGSAVASERPLAEVVEPALKAALARLEVVTAGTLAKLGKPFEADCGPDSRRRFSGVRHVAT